MFETIYRWFIAFYGSDLGQHLSGWDEKEGDFVKMNIFSLSGWIVLATTLIACAIYYYAYDHPRMNRRRKWLLFWLTPTITLNFLVAFSITYTDMLADNISSDLSIFWYNCLGFGLVNSIISAIFFMFISLCFSFGSRNNRYSPFNF